jgi:hypothetical protein
LNFHHALFDLGVLGITEDRLLASNPLDAVLDEGREVPEEWPTSARSRQLAAGVYRGDLM